LEHRNAAVCKSGLLLQQCRSNANALALLLTIVPAFASAEPSGAGEGLQQAVLLEQRSVVR
jgi:hypothetical protein